MRYEPRCKHNNGYDCDICDKSYEDYKVNFENKKEKYDDKAFLKMPNEHLLSDDEREDVERLFGCSRKEAELELCGLDSEFYKE